jgi:hypothetical protein
MGCCTERTGAFLAGDFFAAALLAVGGVFNALDFLAGDVFPRRGLDLRAMIPPFPDLMRLGRPQIVRAPFRKARAKKLRLSKSTAGGPSKQI